MSGEPHPVVVRDLVRRYDSLTAVDRVSFEVQRGEMFGLIGPDGAGKTTTLRCVLGLLVPDGGSLSTCGLDPARRRRELSHRVGYLSQRFSLYGDLSIDENLAFFARIHGVRGWKARRDELLGMLRLSRFRGRLADQLSGGMKQKLALACTLIHTPELLVLDEPTTGVDPVSRRDFWKIVGALRARGMTLLLTTPYLDEAERCSRVALIDHGKLLRVAEPDRLRAGLHGLMVEILARPKRKAFAILRQRGNAGDVEMFGERLHVLLRDVSREAGRERIEELASVLREASIDVRSIRSVTPSLEDVFISEIRAAVTGAESASEGLR